MRVSIHAPTRGATNDRDSSRCTRTCFNPRTHTGCDPMSLCLPLCPLLRFNPRTHTGCDNRCAVGILAAFRMFQSTHPHGVRPINGKRQFKMVIKFQSTHPHGVRRCQASNNCPCWMFQSTHPHGVRPVQPLGPRTFKRVSIHAPTRGAT